MNNASSSESVGQRSAAVCPSLGASLIFIYIIFCVFSGVVFNVWCVRIATRAFKVCRTILLFGLGAHSTSTHTPREPVMAFTHTRGSVRHLHFYSSLSQPNIHWDKLNETPVDIILCIRVGVAKIISGLGKKAASAIWESINCSLARGSTRAAQFFFALSVSRRASPALRRCQNIHVC